MSVITMLSSNFIIGVVLIVIVTDWSGRAIVGTLLVLLKPTSPADIKVAGCPDSIWVCVGVIPTLPS